MSWRPETDWIAKWAHYTPERMVLREHERDVQWTYADFNLRAELLAVRLLGGFGLSRGDRLAVYSRNRAELVLLFAACVKTGVILVPLNFRLAPVELDGIIADVAPTLFLHEAEYAEQVARLEAVKATPHVATIDSLEPLLYDRAGESPAEPVRQDASFDDVVMILYTAGSTGVPKGAMINHRMLFWNAVNTSLRLDLTGEDHTQSYAPFFHTGGWNVLLTPFLHNGASHTLLRTFEPELILELMEREKTTLLFGVPTMLQMMAEAESFEAADLSSVRYAIVGGAPMPEPLINTWHEKGVYIRQGFGLTEVGPNCFSLHQDDAIAHRGSIGFPNFYVEAKIVDEEGKELPSGQAGELWLRGPMVTPGYWRKPDKTAEAITDGWFHTGDVLERDEEGFFYVVDRKKNMFISGGENVYPADVERAIVAHEAVREVCVVGVPDERWGEVGLAFVSLRSGAEALTLETLREFLADRLAKYKIPKHLKILDTLPTNDAGKINRLALAEMAAQR